MAGGAGGIESAGESAMFSGDHLHQFGLPAPLNVESEMCDLLSPRPLTAVTADDVTGDLVLEFDDGSLVEMFTSSTGYESWDLEVGEERFICIGAERSIGRPAPDTQRRRPGGRRLSFGTKGSGPSCLSPCPSVPRPCP